MPFKLFERRNQDNIDNMKEFLGNIIAYLNSNASKMSMTPDENAQGVYRINILRGVGVDSMSYKVTIKDNGNVDLKRVERTTTSSEIARTNNLTEVPRQKHEHSSSPQKYLLNDEKTWKNISTENFVNKLSRAITEDPGLDKHLSKEDVEKLSKSISEFSPKPSAKK